MKPRIEEERLQQASAWFVRARQAPLEESEKRELFAWLRESPDNARAMDLVAGAWNRAPIAARIHGLSRRLPSVSFALRAAAAAIAVLLVIGWRWQSASDDYVSARGDLRQVTLPDGTSLTLAPQSRIALDYSPLGRRLTLVDGEAYVTVAPDWRPFRMRVAGVDVKDVGTRFSARRGANGGTVVLEDGAVELVTADGRRTLAVLRPGTKASWLEGGLRPATWTVNADRETAWKDGMLVFDDLPLSQALDQFERYGTAQFALNQAQIGSLRVSGVFHAADVEPFLTALRKLYGVQYRRLPEGEFRLSQN
jgi:transmembrane sensor